jgi:adenosylcobinamide-GDP ribazoletransferase
VYGFFSALQILTRLPSILPREAQSLEIGSAVGWFPVVGAVLGLALIVLDTLARPVLDAWVVAALLLTFLVVVTGAFHLDGLVDSVDGLTSGPTVEDRLTAMRQAVAGSRGAMTACLLLLADFVAIAALPVAVRTAALLCTPVCGRAAILAAYRLYPYVRTEATLSAELKRGASTVAAALGLAFAVVVCVFSGGPGALFLLGASLVVMVVVGAVALRRLRGLTGDLYGAICELAQLTVLLAAPFALRG